MCPVNVIVFENVSFQNSKRKPIFIPIANQEVEWIGTARKICWKSKIRRYDDGNFSRCWTEPRLHKSLYSCDSVQSVN